MSDALVVTLQDPTSDAVAEVRPDRGGLVTRFSLLGEELLYLDPATLDDPAQNVRGGIPLLFPQAGRLPGNAFTADGKRYTLAQHGFARSLPWSLEARQPERVRLKLASTADTLKAFPFPFVATLEVGLFGGQLTLVFSVQNTGAKPLPLHLGLHPYFRVPQREKADASVQTDATTAFDQRAERIVPPPRKLDLTASEVDLHLLDHRAKETVLRRGRLAPLRLTWSEGFRTLVVWTQGGKDFVCVEPWTGPAGSLLKPQGLPQVAPHATTHLTFTLQRLANR